MSDNNNKSGNRWLDTPAATPGPRWLALLAAYGVAHVIAWILVPLAMNETHPGDNYEQLNWAQNLAWGYDKHPPLPTMLLWVFEQVIPASMPLTYVLGGLQVATLFFVVWWLTRQLLDERRAIVAVLLVSCVTYYTNRLHFYNHNTGLLVAYALSVACTFKAAQTDKLFWYVLLGITWALGMLSKYQMVISIACNVLFLGWVMRQQLLKVTARLLIAGVACAVVLVPHVLWLIDNHFPSFDYAAKFVAANLPWWQRPDDIGSFLLDQTKRIAPLAVWLFIAMRLPTIRVAAQSRNVTTNDAASLAKPFLAIHAWGPLALMCSLSLFAGTDLQMHWGTAFIWTLPIWFLMSGAGRLIASIPLKTLFLIIASLQLVMLVSYR